MNLLNKKILIVGLGKSGVAAARFLNRQGAFVTVTDMKTEEDLGPFAPLVREMGIRMELGGHGVETFEKSDLIVLSPGVPHTILPVRNAKEKGIPVLGETELASRFITEPIVAVTGTNGKTTTTTLLGEMLKKSGRNVFVGGNIGTPLIEYVDNGEKVDVVVAEVSSFQLDTIDTFRPKVALLLNITDDHLDRYKDVGAYPAAKGRIFENQQQEDTAVFNGNDPIVRSLVKRFKSKRFPFFTDSSGFAAETEKGAVITEKNIIFHTDENQGKVLDLKNVILPGKHNIENVAAAGLASLAAGGTFEGIQSALNDFKGLSHRLEYVATITGVEYFDDSKATNVDATARALEAFNRPLVVIMGGRDKGGSYDVLKGVVRKHVKRLILMGEARENIRSALGPIVPTQVERTMEDAVFAAYQAASPGDAVLLSPACSSFDMYDGFAQRGEFFCKAIAELKVKHP
jgi:UDP-N-acetylmuramoylalanine--D-glutamate ligase